MKIEDTMSENGFLGSTSWFLEGLFDEVTGSDVADYDATAREGTDLEDPDWEYTMEGTVCEEPVCDKAVCDDEGLQNGLQSIG